jgi:hypothetical protein
MALTQIGTDGVKDDAVTTDKLANAINTERTANTAKVSTTINNNADNRLITGSGTANTLEGESSLTYNGSDLNISNDVPQLLLTDTNSNDSQGRVRGNGGNLILSADTNNATAGSIINFEIDGSEQARITASGNVGIANNTPTSWGTGIPTVEFKGTGNTSRAGAIAFESQSGNNGYNVIYSDSGNLRIYGGSTNRASTAEKVMFPNSGGITFNGDTAAANALDDYEEGSFQPYFDSTNSNLTFHGASAANNTYYNSRKGSYTKIGRRVFFHISLATDSLTVVGGTGNMRISGLPFTARSEDSNNPRHVLACMGGRFNSVTPHYLVVNPSSTDMQVRESFETYAQATGGTGGFNTSGSSNRNVIEAFGFYDI